MLFNSYSFIYLFLPSVWLLYWGVRRFGPEPGRIILLAASMFFYAYWDIRFLPLLVGSALSNWLLAQRMAAIPELARGRLMWTGIALNLGLLAFFKYAGFISTNLAAATGLEGIVVEVVLPIGISFFTFQQIAFLVDLRRGLAEPCGLVRYVLFVGFFPQLIAGPIVHHRELTPQLGRTAAPVANDVATGLSIFTLGLFKKTVIADSLAQVANPIFSAGDTGDVISQAEAVAGSLAYTLQIYFDFSGYSDMAIGLGLMFGVILPINFNSPLKSPSIIEFWRRWHMTLSRFLRDYLYVPLGGNRLGRTRRYVNLLVTMALGGLWHGAGWGFLIWGLLHGAFLCVNHALVSVVPPRLRLPHWAQVAATLSAVVFAFIFFRATTIQGGWALASAALGFAPTFAEPLRQPLGPLADAMQALGATFGGPSHVSLGSWASAGAPTLVGALLIALFAPNTNQLFLNWAPRPPALFRSWFRTFRTPVVCTVFVLSVLFASTVSEFLYFQF